jgi:PAS domain S-box-containing protein
MGMDGPVSGAAGESEADNHLGQLRQAKGRRDERAMHAIAEEEAADAASVLTIVRIAAPLVMLLLGALWVQDLSTHPATTYALAPVYLLSALIAIVTCFLTFTRWMEKHWRIVVLSACVSLIMIDAVISAANTEPRLLFVCVTLFVLGSGALLPWSIRWQNACNLISLAALGAYSAWAPAVDPGLIFYWMAALTAGVLAYSATLLGSRHRAERARHFATLRESGEKFRRLFEKSVDPVVITDLGTGKLVEINERFTTELCLTREGIIGRTSAELNLWKDADVRARFFADLREKGEVRDLEAEFRGPNGEFQWALISAVVISVGGESCAVTTVRNISMLKRAERALRESEEKFRQIFEKGSDGIVITSLKTLKIIDLNQIFCDSTGIKREAAIGKTSAEAGLWREPGMREKFFAALEAKGRIENLETKFNGINGESRDAIVSAGMCEIGGEPCVLTVTHDISDLKRAEHELRESEATFRQIFDTSVDTIAIWDLETREYVDVNAEFVRSSGYGREEIIGKSGLELQRWACEEQRLEFRRQIDQEGRVRNMEVEFRHKDGTVKPHLVSAVTAQIRGRSCILVMERDITALKATQRELEATREAALAASRAKSEFLSSVSHEIRTPMNAILGMAELLGETQLSGEQRLYLDTIASNGDALLDLINGVLDLAKVESGKLSLETAEFDVVDLTEKVTDTLAVRAHEKRLEIAVRFAPDLPKTVHGDPLRLRQVLTNLVGNAIKFTERGEVVITVGPEPGASTPGALQFSVSDSGIGIAADKIKSIFAAFTQADSSVTRRYGGSGLGLAIVERLVTLMGGRVWVESELGKGSTFHFTVQFSLPDTSRAAAPAAQLDLTDIRILVVDDNATNRLILRETLTSKGAIVSEAASGPEGLEAVIDARHTGQPFTLLLVDCQMPDMDGFEVVQRVRETPGGRDLVIMMISSNDLVVSMNRLKELGLNRYVMKPIKPHELYAAIAETASAAARDAALYKPATSHRMARIAKREPKMPDGTLRILLAEDSPDNRLLVRAYLKGLQCELEEAENGQVAVEKFQTGRYDLVLMDIQMPVLDGYGATRLIRQWELAHRAPHTPIIALTASAFEQDVRRSREAGCDLHVSKPVRKATLREVIAKTCTEAKTPSNESKTPGNGDGSPAPSPVVEVDADLTDLIPGFLKRKREDAQQILQATRKGDFTAVSAFGHKLKGEGGGYGFNRVGELGAALERAAANHDAEAAGQLASELSTYLDRVRIVYSGQPE